MDPDPRPKNIRIIRIRNTAVQSLTRSSLCSGKARRGDGNDLTANPKKLAAIGKELDKLNKEINLMTPVSEVPLTTRSVNPGVQWS